MQKMYKSIRNAVFTLLALALLVGFSPLTAQASDDIRVTIDGAAVTFEGQGPIIVDGRTLVPVRGVFEQLGFTPVWDRDARTATLTREDYTIVITIDSATFTTNGAAHTLDVPAQIMNGSTMLPLRAVLESVGYELNWDSATRTVLITSRATSGTPTAPPLAPPSAPAASPADTNAPPSGPALVGVYVAENRTLDPSIMEFFGNGTFSITTAYADIDLEFDIPGYFSVYGSYVVNEAAQTITLSFTEEDLLTAVISIVDTLMEHTLDEMIAEELGDLANNEALVDAFLTLVSLMIDEMVDELATVLLAEMVEEFEEIVLTFGDNFDRLYDGDFVFVRQHGNIPPVQPAAAPAATTPPATTTPPASQAAPATDQSLVGTWIWLGTPFYVFYANGEGTMVDSPINWTASNGILSICVTPSACGDNCPLPMSWYYEISGNELTLTSTSIPDMTYTYTRG